MRSTSYQRVLHYHLRYRCVAGFLIRRGSAEGKWSTQTGALIRELREPIFRDLQRFAAATRPLLSEDRENPDPCSKLLSVQTCMKACLGRSNTMT